MRKSPLLFGFFATFSLAAQSQNNPNVNTTPSDSIEKPMDEVVVIGYATAKKKDLTGAMSSIKGSELVAQPVLTATQALQSKMAGVQITNSGAPGSTPNVRIRGTGSVIGGAEPLYVVDGVITDDIRNINTADILSIDVLKDASSTAIYGVRAANGVILITTKRGGSGKPKLSYDGYAGVKMMANKIAMARPGTFSNYSNEAAGTNAILKSDINGETDWFQTLTRPGNMNNHNLSMSGGSESTSYLFSVNYFNENGILNDNNYERVSIRSNNEYRISDRLKFGNNISLSRWNSNNKPFSLFTDAYNAAPIYNAKNEDGTYGFTTLSNVGNPLAKLEYTDDKTWGNRFMGNFFTDIHIKKSLKFRSSYGLDYDNSRGANYQQRFRVSPTQKYDTTTLTQSETERYRWIWDNTLTYSPTLKKGHGVQILAGHTAERYDGFEQSFRLDGVPTGKQYRYLNTGRDPIQGIINYQRPIADYGRRESYLGRVSYNYQSKYMLNASFRRDGSSKFPIRNRWGNFPSVGLGWMVSNENFMKNLRTITSLKVRGSWGRVGNDRINPSEFVTLLSTGLSAVFGDQVVFGSTIAEIKDPNLKWETTEEIDLGIDFEAMNGHIAGVMDIYNKKTIGALFNIPLPGGLGDNNNSMLTNAADILNRGLEVSLRYNKNSKGKFNYSLGVNATFNHNEVLGLGNGLPTNFGSLRNGEFATRVATGQAIGSFWVYETQGVFQTQAEVDAVPHFLGTQPGDFKVIDQNKDGKINDLDRIYLGSYQPKCFMGMNGSFKYSNWDLNIDLLGNFGNKVFNGKKTVRYGGNYNIEKAVADARWTPTNGTNTAPRAFNGVPKPTDYFVESGSFVRLNNLTIGYNLPAKIAKKSKVQGYRFFVTAQNAFTWKKFSGFSAELPGNPADAGIELDIYPTSSTFLTGLSIQF
ncbi:SusC/RagA family TonB-linked outer membrane protein [Bacteroidota bacterium]|nr:SusC/RagA family TonB-linked outer membrane protein [Bacteroidota bacterium]